MASSRRFRSAVPKIRIRSVSRHYVYLDPQSMQNTCFLCCFFLCVVLGNCFTCFWGPGAYELQSMLCRVGPHIAVGHRVRNKDYIVAQLSSLCRIRVLLAYQNL